MKAAIGILLALLIGAACRWFGIPVPAPPRLYGALLVVAITLGYLAADRFAPEPEPVETVEASGGPTGESEPPRPGYQADATG